MGDRYEQLSLEERCTIAQLREAGQSIRQIASALDRSPSTISRELSRNSGKQIRYKPIYRFIYAQIRRTKNYAWRHYLPRAKSKRGWRGLRGGSPAELIKMRRSIAERPAHAQDRETPGHWEADFMLFAKYGHNILVAHERATRITVLAKPPDRKSARTARTLARLIGPWPKHMRKTITFDNGTEFAKHYRLCRQIGVETYFCDPHAPWQKGGVENAIGRLRRWLPRKTSLDDLSTNEIAAIAKRYNNTPRKCLDFRTPAEACLIPNLVRADS